MIHDIESSPAAERLLAAGVVQHIGLHIHISGHILDEPKSHGAVYCAGLDEIMLGEHPLRQVALEPPGRGLIQHGLHDHFHAGHKDGQLIPVKPVLPVAQLIEISLAV